METKKHKGKRIIFFGLLAFFVVLLVIPVAGAVAQGAAGVETHSTVLQSNAVVSNDWGYNNVVGTYSTLLNAKTNYTNTISNTFTTTVNKSGNLTSVTNYFNPDILLTNVTVAQLNAHSVDSISIATDLYGNITMTLGTGSSYKNFIPFAAIGSGKTNAVFNFTLYPFELMGNQSSYLMYEIAFGNNTNIASYSITSTIHGVVSTAVNYMITEDAAFAVGGTLLFVFGFFAIPFHSASIIMPQQTQKPVKQPKTKKSRGK